MNPAKEIVMVHPSMSPSPRLRVDRFTLMMAMLLEVANPSAITYREVFTCNCCHYGQALDLPGGYLTNSMAAHYMGYHRDEVPAAELDKIEQAFQESFPGFDFAAFNADSGRVFRLVGTIQTPAL